MDRHRTPSPHPDDIVYIVMREPPQGPIPAGVEVRVRPDLDPELDLTVVDGIPTTTVERTIVDCCETLQVHEALHAIDTTVRRGMLDVTKLQDTIERVQHPRAKRVASRALEQWRRGADLRS